MRASVNSPMLRLVSAGVASTPRVSSQINVNKGVAPRCLTVQEGCVAEVGGAASRRVELENAAAARLTAADARLILARETARRLEGERSAILRPQRRRDLHALAHSVGLRPFDANLVIAIVQDAARHEERALSHGALSRLRLVRPASLGLGSIVPQLITSIVLAILGTGLLVAWVLSHAGQ